MYGCLLFIVALILALLLEPNQQGLRRTESEQLASGANRKCPYCAEVIRAEAVLCRTAASDQRQRRTT
jgi:hypothetical protein